MKIEDESFNITYNVAPMFYKHNEKGIRGLYGKTGKEAQVFLKDMLCFFLENREELEKLNPDNGWGSYEGTLKFLLKLFTVSGEYPEGVWEGD